MPEQRPRPSRVTGSGWSLLVPVAAAVAGVLFATSARTAQGTDLRAWGGGDLADVIRAQTRSAERKAADVQRLRTDLVRLTAASAPGSATVAALERRSASLSAPTGFDAVRGLMLQVSLDDASRRVDSLPKGFTADDIVVHQQDVQGVVNALWAGGAEAMTLQDQRVISTSAVRCVGNTLILQGRVYSPPYVVRAIGDIARMQQSLQHDPSVAIFRQYVAVLGLGYDVTSRPEATFPAYAAGVELLYARAGTVGG